MLASTSTRERGCSGVKDPLLTDQEHEQIEEAVALVSKKEDLQENHRYFATFSRDYGLLGARPGNKRGLSRRQWIERHVFVKNKQGVVVHMTLNPAQRRLEAAILRMERKGAPVRIVILKARQIGFSTYIQAFCFWAILNIANTRCLMVAHRNPTAKAIFAKVHTMRKMLRRADKSPYNFAMPHKSRTELAFDEPMFSAIEVDSAEVDEPGHGDTVQILHKTETSRWKDALRKAKGLEQILPELPGTYGFDETTANGDTGYFRDEFWEAWESKGGTHALFVAWFEQPEYRWTSIHQKYEIAAGVRTEIESTISDDEEVLLTEQYFERGVGWRFVDYDQLAWRRHMLKTKMGSDVGNFNEQYPSTPEEAFLASGRPAYNGESIKRALQRMAVEGEHFEIGPVEPIDVVGTVMPEGASLLERLEAESPS